jgi:hypothetical protein
VQRARGSGSLEHGLALSAIGSTWREHARDGQVGPTSLCARETDGQVPHVGAQDSRLGRAAGTWLMGRLGGFGPCGVLGFPFFSFSFSVFFSFYF